MLRRTPSLALRAVLTFTAVYVGAVGTVLAIVALTEATHSEQDQYRGARRALSFAEAELVPTQDGWRMPRDGAFAELASRNPALWLLVRSGERTLSFGLVPEPAARALGSRAVDLQYATFQVPGLEAPLANAVVERGRPGSGLDMLAAGGADPATLPRRSMLAQLGGGALAILAWIAVVGFAAVVIGLPILSRALRPLAAEAASIAPEDPARRLDEDKAPRELLPLVRGFNAALDRLASELGRRRRFIADAAHELRTPLAVVALRVEALEDEGARQELRRGVERLTHLVSQMLDIERLSLSGRERAPVDLAALARDVVADLAPSAIRSGYDLSLEAPDAPVTVTGDAHAIARAVTNLVVNAIAHGGGSGQIRVVVGADRTIDVADEGPGVPADLRPRLFEPFSRGSATGEGCGLGLHLTSEIMRAHGGEVRLLPGEQGATFRLSFASPEGG